MSVRGWCAGVAALVLVGCGGPKPASGGGAGAEAGETGVRGVDSAGGSHDSAWPELDCAPGENACFGACVDIRSDADNCGACGTVCIVPQGEGACEAGMCAVGECEEGWGDCDGTDANGCETETSCSSEASVPCSTSCETVGQVNCDDVCAPTCEPPEESCNHRDDDCDGVCDNGSLVGCRVAIHRSSGALGHMYGPDLSVLLADGQALELEDAFFLYAAEEDGTRALYRCDKGGGRTFLTTSSTCEFGATPDATIGYLSSGSSCGGIPLYRLYSSTAADHFYTTSESERDSAIATYGYHLESTVGYVYTEL